MDSVWIELVLTCFGFMTEEYSSLVFSGFFILLTVYCVYILHI